MGELKQTIADGADGAPESRWPPLTPALRFLRSVWAVDHGLQAVSRAMATRLGISGPQRLVLRVVGSRPGISAGALAALLYLDPSTLTGHIQKMERGGILTRKTSPHDARRAVLALTPQGEQLDVRTPGTVEDAVIGVLETETPEAIATTERVLQKLARAFHERAADRPNEHDGKPNV